MELDLRDPEFRAIIVIIIVVVALVFAVIGCIRTFAGGGKDGWKSNFKVKYEKDEQNNLTHIYIYNDTSHNPVVEDRFLQVEKITIEADGEEMVLDVDGPTLHPFGYMLEHLYTDHLVVTIEGVYKKVKVTHIQFTHQPYEQEVAKVTVPYQLACLLNVTAC